MAPIDAAQPSRVYRGTVDEVFSHRNEIPADATLELKVFYPVEETVLPQRTLADVLREIGSVKGLPADLSTNPERLKGFGGIKASDPESL